MKVVDRFKVGHQPAARRAVVGPEDAVGHQQRRGPHRRQPDADRPDDRQAGQGDPGRRPVQHVLHARRQVGDRRRRGAQAPRLPRPAHDGAAVARSRCRECAGINHADFSIDGRYAIFTCEFRGSLVKIDLVDTQGRSAICKLSRGGMPQDIRVSPDGKTFYVADMNADGVYVVDGDTFTETGFIPTGPARTGSTRAATASKLYVANRGSHKIHGAAARQRAACRCSTSRPARSTRPGRSRRRQPRHGQRQRRRQDAVAVGPLRRRGLRDRHDDRRGAPASRSARSRTGSRCGRSPGRYSLGHTGNMR